jgi:hypothetical protein
MVRQRIWRRLALLAAAVVLGSAVTVAVAAPAQAADPFYQLRSQATGRCVTNQYLGWSGWRVIADWCGIDWNSRSWQVHHWRDDTYELRSANDGRCLDYSQAYGLRTFTCLANTYQSWYFEGYFPAAATLRNQQYPNLCLDDSWDFDLRVFPCNGLQYQRFQFTWTG